MRSVWAIEAYDDGRLTPRTKGWHLVTARVSLREARRFRDTFLHDLPTRITRWVHFSPRSRARRAHGRKPMSENPKEAVVKETGQCIGWVCMTCQHLHTTAMYLATAEEARAAALSAAARCCATLHCSCGAEVKRYSSQCPTCWRKDQDAKDEARWQAAPKGTIAEYLAEHPDGFVHDDDLFWSVEDYVNDEVFLRHPRVYFCEPRRGIKLDAGDVVEQWADDRHEDAAEELDLAGLQELLDGWCAKQQTCSWFGTDQALDPAEVDRLSKGALERSEAEAAAGERTYVVTEANRHAPTVGREWGRIIVECELTEDELGILQTRLPPGGRLTLPNGSVWVAGAGYEP